MEESTIMVNQYEESYFHAKKRGMKNAAISVISGKTGK